MTDSKKSDMEIQDKAILHQQRRLKQATQFTHKDSADLLPLDGLKRLGTSKDLQPHSIVQRRLLEGNITRLRGESKDLAARVRSPLAEEKEEQKVERKAAEERGTPEESESSDESEAAKGSCVPDEWEREVPETTKEKEIKEEKKVTEEEVTDSDRKMRRHVTEGNTKSMEVLSIHCQCCDKEVKAKINTGHRHNFISQNFCRKLGLRTIQEIMSPEQTVGHNVPLGVTGTVENLELQLGKEKLECSAHVVDETFELCLGLQTLLKLKCCLDLHAGVLKLRGTEEEIPFMESPEKDHTDTI
ncbi:nuclear receptor-interacting protein 2 isoform X2 [Amia ocellicauda]|uniref:nuclear receptor-interacting protein 2 isoform X2 n=1 Tax=Amia ocellicauda TaxID=2972642 RepID=UPI00346494C9